LPAAYGLAIRGSTTGSGGQALVISCVNAAANHWPAGGAPAMAPDWLLEFVALPE
jgi:hypothetical protein